MNEIDYEVRKRRALAFVNMLRRLDSPTRRSVMGVAESEALAGKFVAKYVGNGRSIKAQVAEVSKFAAVIRLWVEHDKDDGRGTLGETLGRSCGNPRSVASAESCVHRLLSCETVTELLDADGPLTDVVFRLKQAGVAVNWPRLLIDMDDWCLKNREIQARWAMDFYASTRGKVAASA